MWYEEEWDGAYFPRAFGTPKKADMQAGDRGHVVDTAPMERFESLCKGLLARAFPVSVKNITQNAFCTAYLDFWNAVMPAQELTVSGHRGAAPPSWKESNGKEPKGPTEPNFTQSTSGQWSSVDPIRKVLHAKMFLLWSCNRKKASRVYLFCRLGHLIEISYKLTQHKK